MPLTVEAIYEGGVLKPAQPLPLQEHEKVQVTVRRKGDWVQETRGMMGCTDPARIEWAALDPELDYPEPREAP